MVHNFQISRILRLYDPFIILELTPEDCQDITAAPLCSPRPLWGLPHTPEKHLGRIRFFMENPDQITPIEVENEGEGFFPVAANVEDGHHRLIAAYLLGWMTIPSEYEGWDEVRRYLVGKRGLPPKGQPSDPKLGLAV